MTSLMEDFGTWTHLRHHHDDQAARAAGTENTMTTPPAHGALADVEEFVGELRANHLLEALYEGRIGGDLTPDEIGHVVAVAMAFEAGHIAAAPAPETPQVMA